MGKTPTGIKPGEPVSPFLFISFVIHMLEEMSENINAVRLLNEISFSLEI